MRRLKIYIDTSVIGGYFDQEFETETKELFDKFIKKEYEIVISDLTQRELIGAPENVKNLFKNLGLSPEIVSISAEVISLANEYLNEKVVGATSEDDCLHIALATIHKVDILVSWNFKHIVNLKRIRGYNAINIMNGYPIVEIRSPKEIIDYEE
ncbi:MAG: type II toxin-antitoxin system VapC family toxin [Bacteroidia bacterium]|nr:type II toxin-antitoxin system VapC family toxin [Bacteroidia bacterium]